MKPTPLGKALVFVNLTLSLVMAAFALGIMTNRVPWVDPVKASEGIIAKRQDQIKQLADVYKSANTRWQHERDELPKLQAQRKDDDAWYAKQLDALVNGPNATINVPVYLNGQISLDQQTKRPVLAPAPNQNWKPVRVMNQLDEATQKEIAQTVKEIQALLDQEDKLTKELNGHDEVRGLRPLMEETQAAEKNAAAELQHVKQLSVNGREETGSLVHRQRQLRARLELLKKIGVAARLP